MNYKSLLFLLMIVLISLDYSNTIFTISKKKQHIIQAFLVVLFFWDYIPVSTDDLMYYHYIMEDFKIGGLKSLIEYNYSNPLFLQNIILYIFSFFGGIKLLASAFIYIYIRLLQSIKENISTYQYNNRSLRFLYNLLFFMIYPLMMSYTGIRFTFVTLLYIYYKTNPRINDKPRVLKVLIFLSFVHYISLIYIFIEVFNGVKYTKIKYGVLFYFPFVIKTISNINLKFNLSYLQNLIYKINMYISYEPPGMYFKFLYLTYGFFSVFNFIFVYLNKENLSLYTKVNLNKSFIIDYNLFIIILSFIPILTLRLGFVSGLIFLSIIFEYMDKYLRDSKIKYIICTVIVIAFYIIQFIPLKAYLIGG